jgi:hypothetical protein
MSRVNQKGRTHYERIVVLPCHMLNSPAWQDLSSNAKVAFIEMKRRYYGTNNGEISLSCREAADLTHTSKVTASRFLKELQSHGFVKVSKHGVFTGRLATTWILTTENLQGHHKTDDWKKWTKNTPFEVPPVEL